jgi:hypothetical protein
MTPLDAYQICGGLDTIRACEDNETRKCEYAEKRAELCRARYAAIPAEFRGSLLLEAVSELAQGNNIDDEIVAAYDAGDDAALLCAVRKMLDGYRAYIAERDVREEFGE